MTIDNHDNSSCTFLYLPESVCVISPCFFQFFSIFVQRSWRSFSSFSAPLNPYSVISWPATRQSIMQQVIRCFITRNKPSVSLVVSLNECNQESRARACLPCQNVVIWSRSFGHFRFRERGYLLTIYININIYIIVSVLTASVFDFDQMTNDQMTACLKTYFFFLKYSRTAMKDSYLCSVKTMKQ